MQKLQRMALTIDNQAKQYAEAAKGALADRREDGQGTIEYVGIIVIISIVIIAVAVFFESTGTKKLTDGIGTVIDNILGKTAA